MLVLEDTVELRAQPDEVYDWFRHLTENYRDWHPDHIACRYVKGSSFEVGSVLYVKERLHGRLHKLNFKLASTVPGQSFSYGIAPGLHGRVVTTPTTSGTTLKATIYIGWNAPIVGAAIDFIVKRLFGAKLSDLQIHMREEGQNLAKLFDTGRCK